MKPHPTKSKPRIAKPSPRHKGGRVMWRHVTGVVYERSLATERFRENYTPVLVLDLSPEARERRVEAGARSLYPDKIHWNGLSEKVRQSTRAHVRHILASLGDTPANEGRGK